MTSWTQNNLTLAPPSERGCPAGRPPPWCPFHPRPRRPVKPFTAVVPGHRTGPEWRGAWLKAHRNLQGNDIGYRWGDFNENPCVSWGRSAIKIIHTIETSREKAPTDWYGGLRPIPAIGNLKENLIQRFVTSNYFRASRCIWHNHGSNKSLIVQRLA